MPWSLIIRGFAVPSLVRFGRDAAGRLVEVTQPTGRSYRYEWGECGRWAATVSTGGDRREIVHDADSRIVGRPGRPGRCRGRFRSDEGRLWLPDQARVGHSLDWADVTDPEQRMPLISMDGRTVFRWATTYITTKALEAVKAAGITPEELDVFIPHQANNRITDSMLRHLKLPENVVVSRDIRHMGNSSAASIPLAMEALLESGRASSGQNALIIGFGAGLVFAGQVVALP